MLPGHGLESMPGQEDCELLLNHSNLLLVSASLPHTLPIGNLIAP